MASALGVGIDVSKDKVDVAVSDGPWHATFLQTRAGLDQLVSKLTSLDAHRVVLEASGGYERALLAALAAASLPEPVNVNGWRTFLIL